MARQCAALLSEVVQIVTSMHLRTGTLMQLLASCP